MKLLLTGGAGFIGSFLTRDLVERGHDVVTVDSFISYVSPLRRNYLPYLEFRFDAVIPDAVESVRADTRNRAEMGRVLRREEPDVVVHLAGLPIATVADEHTEEAITSQVGGTVNVLEAVRDADVRRLVYGSSSMVYGDFEYAPIDEGHPTVPLNVYGGAKYAGEVLTETYARRFGFQHVIVRPSAVYGPTDANRRVTQVFVERALDGEPIELHGGGEQRLDFTYVEDAAQGIALAATAPAAAAGVYNVTRGEGRSIRELAEVVTAHAPTEVVETEPQDIDRPERGALDITAARSDLGYDPEYALEDAIPEYVEWVREVR